MTEKQANTNALFAELSQESFDLKTWIKGEPTNFDNITKEAEAILKTLCDSKLAPSKKKQK